MIKDFRKAAAMLGIFILALVLVACGGRKTRIQDIPTEDEAKSAVEKETGIRGVRVLDVQDVREGGAEYYGIDAVYTMTCDRGIVFTVLRSCEYDTLFGTGYHYRWISDYSDAVMEEYLRDHPLPEGISWSEGPYGRHNYGASAYFGEQDDVLWFTFASDEEFEDYLDTLEPWLDGWFDGEKAYFSEGKSPHVRVVAYRPQDETMKSVILISRAFGYDKDSFYKKF